jgi:signal transduction histidine kinase
LIALVKEVAVYCRLNENISFAPDFVESQFFVFADPALFRQVFINLYTNAEQAMPDGGTITVAGTHSSEGETVILVSDTGCGVDEADRTKVFDVLHTTKAGGAGLGLSLCRDILQRHDGAISIINDYKKHSWLGHNWKKNKGANIVITLPNKIHDGKKTN